MVGIAILIVIHLSPGNRLSCSRGNCTSSNDGTRLDLRYIFCRTRTITPTTTQAITRDNVFDQNSHPDHRRADYNSGVYQTEVYDDPNGDSDKSQSDDSIIVAAQERLARQAITVARQTCAQR